MAQRYADSSPFFLQNATVSDPDAKYQVGRFKMAINVHAETALSVSQDTTDNFTDLFQLSQLFLQQIGLGPNHEGRKHVLSVVELAVKFVPGDSTEHQLKAALSYLAEDKRRLITSLIAQRNHNQMNEIERLREIIARTRSIAPSQLEETTESNDPLETPPPTKKRKERGGYENLDDVREYLNKAKVWKDWNSLFQRIVVLPRQNKLS
jgi:hypothetical protein